MIPQTTNTHLLQAFATSLAGQREKYVSQWQRTRAEVDLSAHTKDGGSVRERHLYAKRMDCGQHQSDIIISAVL
jgi:hypothetical protein